MRFQDYFIVNGKRYPTGTVFLLEHMGNKVEATFICYDLKCSLYVYKIKEFVWRSSAKVFWRKFIGVTDRMNYSIQMPKMKTLRDKDIDGLFVGWVWYIFLMVISTIFNDRIGLWVLFTGIFFFWRRHKIKENGTYVKW